MCKAGQTNCAGSCVSVFADAKNCGKCTKACASSYSCCGAACADLQTDVKNCGKCGSACASVCIKGACQVGWATGFGAQAKNSLETINDLAKDASGNTYALGTFNLELTLGTTKLSSKGHGRGLFVAKYDSAMKLVWVAKGLSSGIYPRAIATDSAGTVHVVGYFNGQTLVFGSHTIKNSGGRDVFVAKLDSTGKWAWATASGGAANEHGHGIAADSSGNIYIAGDFQSPTTGASTFGSTTLTSSGTDLFVAKLDKTGKWLWAVKAGGSGADYGNDLALDGSGNPHVTGRYGTSASFGPHGLTSKGGDDVFVAKLNTSGVFQWAATAGSSSYDYGQAITVDTTGNSYVTGRHRKDAVFGSTTLATSGTSTYNEDIFVAKIDKSGKWQWAMSGGGSSYDYGEDLALDGANNVYATGRYQGTASFGSSTLIAKGSTDVFVAKLDGNGKWQWATSLGGTGSDHGNCIMAGSTIRLGGAFSDSVAFGSSTLTAKGGQDAFVATLDSTGSVTKHGHRLERGTWPSRGAMGVGLRVPCPSTVSAWPPSGAGTLSLSG